MRLIRREDINVRAKLGPGGYIKLALLAVNCAGCSLLPI